MRHKNFHISMLLVSLVWPSVHVCFAGSGLLPILIGNKCSALMSSLQEKMPTNTVTIDELSRWTLKDYDAHMYRGLVFKEIRATENPYIESPQYLLPVEAFAPHFEKLAKKIMQLSFSEKFVRRAREKKRKKIENGPVGPILKKGLSSKEYSEWLASQIREIRQVEIGAWIIQLKRGRQRRNAILTSSEQMVVHGEDMMSAVNGLMRKYDIKFSDIERIDYQHVHPSINKFASPLNKGDESSALSIKQPFVSNGLNVSIGFHAVTIHEGQLLVYSANY